jgi:Raf kinase inhibitor-like YbhB/YbcL family protein
MSRAAKHQEHTYPLAMERAVSGATPELKLNSPSFKQNGAMPRRFSAEGEGLSPALQWQPGPPETQSYALVVEDPDAPQDLPFVHWVLYAIPADTTDLHEGIPTSPVLNVPQEALQGLNDRQNLGWFGPLPPEGHGTHHYHFQLFALDRVLDLHYGATREMLVEALKGHVLACGHYVGTYER